MAIHDLKRKVLLVIISGIVSLAIYNAILLPLFQYEYLLATYALLAIFCSLSVVSWKGVDRTRSWKNKTEEDNETMRRKIEESMNNNKKKTTTMPTVTVQQQQQTPTVGSGGGELKDMGLVSVAIMKEQRGKAHVFLKDFEEEETIVRGVRVVTTTKVEEETTT